MIDQIVFLDIETISGMDKPKPEDIKVPGNYAKPETIAKYQLEQVEEVWKKQALDSLKGTIYCIGYRPMGEETKVVYEAGEKETLAEFSILMEMLRGQYREPLKFIGWNISTFDLPWLWRKALKYDLKYLRDTLPKENRTMVIDLMRVFAADFKDFVSLSNAAKFLGIEHDDTFSGKDVHEAWLKGDSESIITHCKDDIRAVNDIYDRIYGR